VSVCWCRHLPAIDTETRVVVIQHPREERVAIGTARMASLCLTNAKLVVGVEVEKEPEVVAALNDPSRPAVLLWPGPGARDLATDPPSGPVTLIVVDGTWSLAKKLVRVNPALARLPRYALAPSEPSQYRIRREPRLECVSTIEAIQHALAVLEKDATRFRPMLEPFRAMIDSQIEAEERCHGSRHLRRPRSPREMRLPSSLSDRSRLVVVSGEANAWPFRRRVAREGSPERHPDELIHLLAYRVETGERLDIIVAPEHPLSPSTPLHSRLDAELIRSGTSEADLLAAWRAFVRDDDVVCGYGYYAAGLLKGRGGFLPSRYVDVRTIATQSLRGTKGLREKPRSIEDFAGRFGNDWEPLGRGRGGARLAMTVGILEALLSGTRPPSIAAAPAHQ
jgi:DTW domain-containing protein YfiP